MSGTLPPGWEKVLDRNSGQYYFYNARLGVTQWDPPQVGAQKTKATFVTTTTRKKVVKTRPQQPVAYTNAHRAPAAYQQHTVTTTTSRGGGGGGGTLYCGTCNTGDAIFIGTLVAIGELKFLKYNCFDKLHIKNS